jgi:hypothetical protein
MYYFIFFPKFQIESPKIFPRKYEPNAQKVYRLLRYSLTGIFGCVRAVAQRGPDEAAERLRAERGGGGIVKKIIFPAREKYFRQCNFQIFFCVRTFSK